MAAAASQQFPDSPLTTRHVAREANAGVLYQDAPWQWLPVILSD